MCWQVSSLRLPFSPELKSRSNNCWIYVDNVITPPFSPFPTPSPAMPWGYQGLIFQTHAIQRAFTILATEPNLNSGYRWLCLVVAAKSLFPREGLCGITKCIHLYPCYNFQGCPVLCVYKNEKLFLFVVPLLVLDLATHSRSARRASDSKCWSGLCQMRSAFPVRQSDPYLNPQSDTNHKGILYLYYKKYRFLSFVSMCDSQTNVNFLL